MIMKYFISSLLVLCGIIGGTYFYENKVSEPVNNVEVSEESGEVSLPTAIEPVKITVEPVKSIDYTFNFSFAGDVLIASQKNQTISGSFNEYANNKPASYFFENMTSYFQDDDYTIVNLENVLSDNKLNEVYKDYSPAFWFYSKVSNTDILTTGGIDVVSLSNNHYGDYGVQGQLDTQYALNGAGIQWGYDDKTVYLEKNGYTVALICNGLWGEWQADNIIKRIKEAETQSDFQIVYYHGGKERLHKPEDWKVRASRKLVDNGADLVIGNHPHVLQPVENYNGVDIVYSLGNFCFGGNTKPENRTVLMQYTLNLTKDNESGAVTLNSKAMNLIPCYVYTGNINNYQPALISDEAESQKVLDFMSGNRELPY